MSAVTHQTVKLSKGKHSSPESGACVMELASMLAGEPFSDHPASVCPVIGSFMRAYNDSIDEHRRQDLYSYAAKVVGSRASAAVEKTRAERLGEWAAEIRPRRWTRGLPARLRAHALKHKPPAESLGTHAVHAIRRHTDDTHAAALTLVDELLEIRSPGKRDPVGTPPDTRPSAPLTPAL
jgi:hypothetical protein